MVLEGAKLLQCGFLRVQGVVWVVWVMRVWCLSAPHCCNVGCCGFVLAMWVVCVTGVWWLRVAKCYNVAWCGCGVVWVMRRGGGGLDVSAIEAA